MSKAPVAAVRTKMHKPKQRMRTSTARAVSPVMGTADTSIAPDVSAVLETLLGPEEMLHLSRLATIGQLSVCFAHEVNNVLSMIDGNASLAQQLLPPDHPVIANLAAIDRSSKRIDAMSKRMLAFGRTRPTFQQSYDIKDIITEAVQLLQPYFHYNDLLVTVDIPAGLPEVTADRWQIIQVLINLLHNAGDALLAVSG